jgi:hypothetical protein
VSAANYNNFSASSVAIVDHDYYSQTLCLSAKQQVLDAQTPTAHAKLGAAAKIKNQGQLTVLDISVRHLTQVQNEYQP